MFKEWPQGSPCPLTLGQRHSRHTRVRSSTLSSGRDVRLDAADLPARISNQEEHRHSSSRTNEEEAWTLAPEDSATGCAGLFRLRKRSYLLANRTKAVRLQSAPFAR